MKNRLLWATEYGIWTPDRWSKVIFSDECSIQTKPFRRVLVRRMNYKRYQKPYTIKTVKYGGK